MRLTVLGLSAPVEPRRVTVRSLLEQPVPGLSLTLLAGGAGLDRCIDHPRVQKSGLVLAGHLHGVVPTRVQVLGETELSYLEGLGPAGREAAARALCSVRPSLVLVTRGATPPAELLQAAEASGSPVAGCAERSSQAITALHVALDERLAPRTRLHGVLVDVFEVGVLLLGKSAVGKSECALELVLRGHRLVADDVVEVDHRPPGMVFGQAAELLRHHIEVRGLGILNLKDLFGVTSVRERKRIDLVVQLEAYEPGEPYERLGLEERTVDILGVPVRLAVLPVRPGRNMSSIIEIAARDTLLRQAGGHGARELVQALEARGAGGFRSAPPRPIAAPESSAPPPVESGRRR